jgi:hypothetical protein
MMGPIGLAGRDGTTPSLDEICDRVVEILDPRASTELIRELGSRWPVAAVDATDFVDSADQRQFRGRGTFLLGLFLEAEKENYDSFLVKGKFDPDAGFRQFGTDELAQAEVALGVTEHALYVVKDRYGEARVIR